jgi:hypothetical protein
LAQWFLKSLQDLSVQSGPLARPEFREFQWGQWGQLQLKLHQLDQSAQSGRLLRSDQ